MSGQHFLTEEDVSKLLKNPSGDVRAETAAKLAREFDSSKLGERERTLAEEIFRLMVRDAEVRVRESLSEHLKANPMVPHDVAIALAKDVSSVSLPVLRFSEVLTDEDLIEIVNSHDEGKSIAIAERPSVSASVAEALVETNDENVVARLVSNDGADISEKTFERVVENFGDKESVQKGMVNRSKLPVTISERLVSIVSEHLKEQLVTKHELPNALATDLFLQAREKATLGLSEDSTEAQLESMVQQMHRSGRLTPSILLRSLSMGDIRFFEAAMAEMAGVQLVNVRVLIHDSGDLGLKGLYNKTGLPEQMFPIFRCAVEVSDETDYDGREQDRERYSRRMIERIMTQYEELGIEIDSDDIDYLLGKMNELPGEPLPQN